MRTYVAGQMCLAVILTAIGIVKMARICVDQLDDACSNLVHLR